MIGDQKTRDDGYVNVSTKVPVHIAALLNLIAKAKGVETYELLQLAIQAIITAAKAETDLSPTMKLLMSMIDIDGNWQRAFNLCSPTARYDIAQMILVLQQHDGEEGEKGKARNGFGLVMIDKPYMTEEPKQTLCVDDILERVAEVSMKGLYKKLRQIGVELESNSLRETLVLMCDAQEILNIDESNRHEMPQIGNFHDFGRIVEYGQKFKRVRRRTPDSLANSQQRIQFDDYDRELADEEAGPVTADDIVKDIGCRPFDVEP